jgi:hypothetical protein
MEEQQNSVGRPTKWEDVKEKLFLIENWAKEGLTNADIAKKLGIAMSTFCEYQNKYSEFKEALKKGKEIIDYQVENALLKKALGYSYEEKTYEKEYNELIGEYTETLTKRVIKEVAPDTTAQIFWLKNRKPELWADKHQIENTKEPVININMVNNENLEKDFFDKEE